MSSARAGTFLATPVEWAVNNSKNGLPQFVCRFGLDEEIDGEQQVDVAQEGMEVTGYFNLIYKDKQTGQNVRNDINIKQLEAALGWTDRKMDTLNGADWSQTQVQLVLEDEEYNGKVSAKIKYLNPKDYEGGNGVKKPDPEALKAMATAFGALLSAGATPAARPVSNPAMKPPVASANPLEAAKRAAWDAFNAKHAGKTPTSIATAWKEAIQAYFAKPANMLGAAQWREFKENGFAKPGTDPIDDTPQFKEDDIPF